MLILPSPLIQDPTNAKKCRTVLTKCAALQDPSPKWWSHVNQITAGAARKPRRRDTKQEPFAVADGNRVQTKIQNKSKSREPEKHEEANVLGCSYLKVQTCAKSGASQIVLFMHFSCTFKSEHPKDMASYSFGGGVSLRGWGPKWPGPAARAWGRPGSRPGPWTFLIRAKQ